MKKLYRVAFDQFDPRKLFAHVPGQSGILLDGNDVLGTVNKRFRQHAESRPDLQHRLVAPNVGFSKNDLEDVAVDQEILPQRLAGTDAKLVKQSSDFGQCHPADCLTPTRQDAKKFSWSSLTCLERSAALRGYWLSASCKGFAVEHDGLTKGGFSR